MATAQAQALRAQRSSSWLSLIQDRPQIEQARQGVVGSLVLERFATFDQRRFHLHIHLANHESNHLTISIFCLLLFVDQNVIWFPRRLNCIRSA